MLENNPLLRERVLGVTAISAILIGGAVGLDTMITSGWQIGGDDAHAAYADATPQQYFDDVGRDWTTTPPQHVELASADAGAISLTQARENLDGASVGAQGGGSGGVSGGPSEAALIPTILVPTILVPTAPTPTAPVPAAPTGAPAQAASPPAAGDLAMAAQAANQRFDAIEADIQQATPQTDDAAKDSEPITTSDNQG